MWAVLALFAELAHLAGNPWQRGGQVARIGRTHAAGLPEAHRADRVFVAAVGVDTAVAVITHGEPMSSDLQVLMKGGGLRYGG